MLEVERLRRHTRLFEPTWRTRDGIVSLVTGAVVSLVTRRWRCDHWVLSQVTIRSATATMNRLTTAPITSDTIPSRVRQVGSNR